MTTIYIDSQSHNLLMEWIESNKWKVINALPFYKEVRLIFSEDKEYEGFFKYSKSKGYKYSLRDCKRQFVKGHISHDTVREDKDFIYTYDISKELLNEIDENQDNDKLEFIQYLIRLFCSSFLSVNAFLWYGNLVDEKKLIAQGKNLSNSKIIVFKPFQNKIYAVPVNHHRSPEGVFEVRGHFRKYKSGKIVWIDSYLKGTDKEQKNDN